MNNLVSILFVWPLEFKIIAISVTVDVIFLFEPFALQSKIILKSSSPMRNYTSGTFHLLWRTAQKTNTSSLFTTTVWILKITVSFYSSVILTHLFLFRSSLTSIGNYKRA